MSEATGDNGADDTKNSTLLNFYHNLRIAEECFRYLLRIVDEDKTDRNHPEHKTIKRQIDMEDLLQLCAVNIELIGDINEILSGISGNTGPGRIKHKAVTGIAEPSKQTAANENLNQLFRESIVNLMVLSVQCWEQYTNKSKIELAEESRIWCVNVDGGRLRVRSMDRYLGINKLPKVPRWRDVVRTAYFVLDRVDGDSAMRKRLEESLEHTLRLMRRLAL